MKERKDVLIIIPAYNEEKNISGVIAGIKNNPFSPEVLVIDDGSTDNTSLAAQAAGAIAIKHLFNMGYGVALQTGYKYALSKRYDYIAQLDADGQHDPRYIDNLICALKEENLDVVIGSRFMNNQAYDVSLIRRMGMIIFSSITSLVIKQKITDSTSGFRALSRRAIGFLCGNFYPADYPDADIIILLHFAGFRIKEIPVVFYPPRGNKGMHRGCKKIYYVFKMLLSIIMTIMREKPTKKERGDDDCPSEAVCRIS